MEPAVLPRPVGHTRPIRVLVVDDNAGFRESLLSLLEAGNLQVVGEAGSGVEALGLARSLAPDVVQAVSELPVPSTWKPTSSLSVTEHRVTVFVFPMSRKPARLSSAQRVSTFDLMMRL